MMPPHHHRQGVYVIGNGVDSWAVLCNECDECLAVVNGPRDEVFADL